MSKKHFIALADVIRANNKDEANRQNLNQRFWPSHIELLADFCADMNPCFNRQRWLDYIDGKCGPNGGAR